MYLPLGYSGIFLFINFIEKSIMALSRSMADPREGDVFLVYIALGILFINSESTEVWFNKISTKLIVPRF